MGVMNVDSLTLIQEIEAPGKFGRLRGLNACVLLKWNTRPSYFKESPLAMHIKPLVTTKLWKLINGSRLEVSHDSATLVVV